MRFSHVAVTALTLSLFTAACSGDNDEGTPSVAPSSTPTALPTLTFVVKGTCTSAGGTLYADGAGFTPGGYYLTQVTQPNGKPYTGEFTPQGTASAAGTTPSWTWQCNYKDKGDPPGKYIVTMVDRTTGRTVTTTFTIGKP